jgi:[acyl-carrier-protein] S-malonyltransferase
MTAVAWIDGAALDQSEVDNREAAIRTGPAKAALPSVDSSEGRQLRRWLVQLMAAERLVAAEPNLPEAPDLAELAPDNAALLELGSVAATLLSQNPHARAVFRKVTEHIHIPPERIAGYYRNNLGAFTVPEQRTIQLDDYPLRTIRRGELTGPIEQAVFAATEHETVGPITDPLGTHVVHIKAIHPAHTKPLDEVASEIERRLRAVARRRAFTAWLDGRIAELVRLAPGYEHPGDPSQPDNTHRH